MSNPPHPHSYKPYIVPSLSARTAAASTGTGAESALPPSDSFSEPPDLHSDEARRSQPSYYYPTYPPYQPLYDSGYLSQSPPERPPHAPNQSTPFLEQVRSAPTSFEHASMIRGGDLEGVYGGGAGGGGYGSNLPFEQSQFNMTPIASTSVLPQQPQQPQQRYYSAPAPRQPQRPRALSDTTTRPPPTPYQGASRIPLTARSGGRGTGVGRGRGERITARNPNWRARGGFSGQDFDAKVPRQSQPLSPLSQEEFLSASRERQALSDFLSTTQADQQESPTFGGGGLFPLTTSLLPDRVLLHPSAQSFKSSLSSTSEDSTSLPYPTPQTSTIGSKGFDSGNAFDYESFAASGGQSEDDYEEEEHGADDDWAAEEKLPGEGRFSAGPGFAKKARVKKIRASAKVAADPLSGLTDKASLFGMAWVYL